MVRMEEPERTRAMTEARITLWQHINTAFDQIEQAMRVHTDLTMPEIFDDQYTGARMIFGSPSPASCCGPTWLLRRRASRQRSRICTT